ncbi:MAG: type III-B CRISPR module RAMP protein Cmr1, partial [Anaerolineae bacterium]|nr:type III-B CRISPR module RAMP protein Cmr1 [Thermoflexales bacterium]MDW8408766.1 type III-B CRISPR module RAMP protein Cmr1 [Anaerolineae bacterium]
MSEPLSLTVTLETVTPLFLGGANPRAAPELRPPSFRGVMRYWLRALVGAAGEQAMREQENRLFGVVGDQASAGAVSLRLSLPTHLPKQTYSRLSDKRMGTGYLWFAARGTRNEPERHAIMPTTFSLTLLTPRSKQPERDLEQIAAVLWLLTRLGGVGARSRRFAGGVQVADVQSPHTPDGLIARLPIRANSPKELADEIAQGIQTARRLFGLQKLATPAPSQFDVLHPDQCQIFVLNHVFPSWEQAVEQIGQVYQKFRHLRQPDYKVVKQAMISGQDLSGTVERAAFGLPIPFFYRSLSNRTSTLQAEKQDGEKLDRRASPLWMRAVKLSNGEYAVVFTWFKSQFLLAGARFLLTEKKQPDLHGSQLLNDQLISTFLLGNDDQNGSALK